MTLNKKLIISSIIIVLLTVPLIPYSYSDGFKFKFGYPIPYFTTFSLGPIRNNEILLSRININELALIFNILLIYVILKSLVYLKDIIKSNFIKNEN